MLDEIWKATSFIVLALQRRANIKNCAAKFVCIWLVEQHRANVGPTPFFCSKKGFVSFASQHRANIGPTSRLNNIKNFNSLVYQHSTNVGPTLLFFVKAHVFFQFYETNAMIHCSSIYHNYFDKSVNVIVFIVVCSSRED